MAFTISNPSLQDKLNDFLDTLQNCTRSFLIGAGCSKCANLPLTGELADIVLKSFGKTDIAKVILETVRANFVKDPNITIEEYISEIVDYASILERRVEKGSVNPTMQLGGKNYNQIELKEAVIEIQRRIVEAIESRVFSLGTHNDFIRAIHYRLDAGRSTFNVPTNYFVLNYDTLIEDALSMNKVNYADGFRGGAIGWWDISVFDDVALKACLFKLHGSLDWCISKDDTMPRRLKRKSKHSAYNFDENVLIYPCATKYKETQNDPFAQLLNQYRNKLKNLDKSVLTICGYRFADSHINVEIEKALFEGRNLTVVVFTELESPNDHPVLKKWFDDQRLRPYLKFFTKRGYYHHDDYVEEDGKIDLDWWKFEVLTGILNK